MTAWAATADVVVVGSGVAGLTTARRCAAAGLRVLVVTKSAVDEGSTRWAQGGIAVVDSASGDSVAAHLQDTLVAGSGLTDPVAAAAIVTEGVSAVAELRALGARFDTGPFGLLRTREGGHHRDRIIHAGGDATGAEVERALLAAPGLPAVLAGHFALDVLRDDDGAARGISVLDPDGRVGLIRAGATVLATGGCGQLFAATTNPSVATADGLAMALRAGASVADVEFIQFHPTVLFASVGAAGVAGGQRPLVSEAVRGAGALLIDGAGHRVMAGIHPLEDLAPRDVVALAITRRMAENPGGIDDHVFLDATMVDDFDRRFPTVTASCAAAGIDPATAPIPVAPASHYHCGGVETDLRGRTSVAGLYAVGEVGRTGLHGANRLASNSLLEGLVMGERAAEDIVGISAATGPARSAEAVDVSAVTTADPRSRTELQAQLSRFAGIGRDRAGLAAIEVPAVSTSALPAPSSSGPSSQAPSSQAPSSPERNSAALELRDSLETANLVLAAGAVIAAAGLRTESRGCHVRLDHPERLLGWAQPISLTLDDGAFVVADLREAVAS
ncbi:L-aspartate oxidase [Nakamurella lactea]|uniref:L-aspartate oxidase n=1 Tax=Nakamurella lactea TaxID=459515 RepID=UPI0004026C2F|nr:L-aspartate oxidase [Nakamurella lactea]